ncbi:hypothetical protein GGH98_002687 [Coemansia sp. RSA 454]|nr:hypothetical protein GGH98_002687 [Coemansia sp. RSA 454]
MDASYVRPTARVAPIAELDSVSATQEIDAGLVQMGEDSGTYTYEDSLGSADSFYDAENGEKGGRLQRGPWGHFYSASDRLETKTRVLPSVAAILMPITVLFVLTSVEGNWAQSAPGFNGLRLNKGSGYVVGNAVATALAFGSALTIAVRNAQWCRRFISLTGAAASQVAINVVLGAVCVTTGAVFQRNELNGQNVFVTPEYVCIYVGAALAFLQALLLAVDWLTTRNFNSRGHGFGGGAMQGAIFLANIVAIWTGFGSLVFSSVESKTTWHAYNSCFQAWVLLLTTGANVMAFNTANSIVFIFFWLPVGLLIMFVFFCCFGIGFVQRFDEKPQRRIRETEDRMRAAHRDFRRARAPGQSLRIDALRRRLAMLHTQRLHYFSLLFVVAVVLKICSWCAASVIFTRTEPGWSYWDSLVFVFFTLLTVGIQRRVPSSSAGMPLYHAYTFIDILCTAAIDAMLVHIVWNLVPWPQYTMAARALVARIMRRPELPQEPGTTPAPMDRVDAIVAAATRMRLLLGKNNAPEDDLREYDQLLLDFESQIDDFDMSEKPSVH